MEQSTLNFIYFLAVIGGLCFVYLIAKLLWTLVKFILPGKDFKERYGAHSWAVITGGSDGIGLGFAEELAEKGFNICIMARNNEKMKKTAQSLKKLNQDIETMCVVTDFADSQKEGFYEDIKKCLNGLDISILVNNVGISNIGYLHEISGERLFNEININTVPMVMMSHMVIPKMLQRQKRGAIINISSIAGEYPIPYLSVYSATKAFNRFFSQSIEMEYSSKIDILSVKPMYVASNMSKLEKSCTVASRNECASASLRYLGIEYETNGYFVHRLLAYMTSLMPSPLLRCVSEAESRKTMEKENQ